MFVSENFLPPFCLLPLGFYNRNAQHFYSLPPSLPPSLSLSYKHTHTAQCSSEAAEASSCSGLINNFPQLKSGLETYLSLHAIRSPLRVQLALPPLPRSHPSIPLTPRHLFSLNADPSHFASPSQACPSPAPAGASAAIHALAPCPPARPLPLLQQSPSVSGALLANQGNSLQRELAVVERGWRLEGGWGDVEGSEKNASKPQQRLKHIEAGSRRSISMLSCNKQPCGTAFAFICTFSPTHYSRKRMSKYRRG